MKTPKANNYNSDFVSIERLLKAMRYDPVINKKVVNILNMDSYQRRIVLSNWLEHLRRKNAPQTLMQALSYLFDDGIAYKVLAIVNNHKIKNSENDLFLNNTKF